MHDFGGVVVEGAPVGKAGRGEAGGGVEFITAWPFPVVKPLNLALSRGLLLGTVCASCKLICSMDLGNRMVGSSWSSISGKGTVLILVTGGMIGESMGSPTGDRSWFMISRGWTCRVGRRFGVDDGPGLVSVVVLVVGPASVVISEVVLLIGVLVAAPWGMSRVLLKRGAVSVSRLVGARKG